MGRLAWIAVVAAILAVGLPSAVAEHRKREALAEARIAARTITFGMTEAEVLKRWGAPFSILPSDAEPGVGRTLWVYLGPHPDDREYWRKLGIMRWNFRTVRFHDGQVVEITGGAYR